MRILVTGGAGFIGSHLCERLLAQHHEVVALDNFLSGSLTNIAALRDHPHFKFIKWDVTRDYANYLPALAMPKFDRIYNLACPASPNHYQRYPIQTTLTNVLGTRHALKLAKRHSARILQASTSEVYGDPEVHPQREDYRGNVSITGPRACYDEGKRCAETLVSDYERVHDLRVRIARIFNTYGPRMAVDDGRVVSNFIVQALRDEPLTIYGDGNQTRSLCFVDDTVSGLMLLMEQDLVSAPVNIGNPHEITVHDLAERIMLMLKRGHIEWRPLPQDDPRRRCPDITRARSLGFEPKVSLDDGLMRTIAYFRQLVAESETAVANA